MARYCGEDNSEFILEAADQWKQRCLLEQGSVFSERKLWNLDNLAQLETYFVNQLDAGEGDFFEKLEKQLELATPEAKQLAAEMLWVMLLCPSNIGPDSKRSGIQRIWAWSGQGLDAGHPLLTDSVLTGIGSSGTAYNTNRWRELVFVISLSQRWFALPLNERAQLLQAPWKMSAWLENVPQSESRQFRHMLLFLLFPDTFERIFGGSDRKTIVTTFSGKSRSLVNKLTPHQLDDELAKIRSQAEQEFNGVPLDFYVSPLREQWVDQGHRDWLFAWNPENWEWQELAENISQTREGETVVLRWRCANSEAKAGDRAWLVRLGKAPKGIFASGNVLGEPYEAEHYDAAKAAAGETCQYVDIEFTRILDAFSEPFLSLEDVGRITIDGQNWSPQSSGIEIKKRSAGLLEKLWKGLAEKAPVAAAAPPRIQEPVNRILFGPPGTGKTYELTRLKARYTTSANTVSRGQWLAEELMTARWFDVVFMALYALGGKARVADLEAHEYVQQKARITGRTRHIKPQIWATLQVHTGEESTTVKYAKRQAPFVFDKTPDSEWILAQDWQESCADLVAQADRLKAGQTEGLAQKRYEFVTFHQSYSYEDFVEGIRPIQDEESGELVYRVLPGVFRKICQRAKSDPSQRYAIFIDEINRGNISRIFGELITLIEKDKRAEFGAQGELVSGLAVTLPYSGDSFSVPRNLDIYGTMNTADRSIALLDTALRRRFAFKELMPDSGVITGSRGDGYIEDGQGGVIDLRRLLDTMNQRIAFLLSRDLTLGHAYLTRVRDFNGLREVLLNQFIPLLQEYFYEDWHRIQWVLGDVGPEGEKIEPQIVRHRLLTGQSVFGFDYDGLEERIEYSVAPLAEISPEAIRKIYEGPM